LDFQTEEFSDVLKQLGYRCLSVIMMLAALSGEEDVGQLDPQMAVACCRMSRPPRIARDAE
jgi:hypothetical protein